MKKVLTTISLAAAAVAASAACADPAQEKAVARSADSDSLEWGPCPPIFPGGCEIAVLHGDPAKLNADVFLRVPGGYAFPAHTHNSAERMILSQGKMRVRYKGQAAATFSAGDYAYGPPELPHEAACISDGPCTLFIAFVKPVNAKAYDGSLE